MSALAAQLAKNASLNAELLADRSRRKPAESYLFTGRSADHYDLESIHSLGVNGLLQLALLDSSLRIFEEKLFSEYAKSTDRTLLSVEANAELDIAISAMLASLGPYVMEAPTGKVLEWLVRRFRINEFNVEAVLSLFLPYHETVHFAKMLSILHIRPNSTWSFLLPFKAAAQNLPRTSLVTEMLRNPEIARFVVSLLPLAIKEHHSHRVLLAFNAACLHAFITRSQNLNEGDAAYLLPALLEPLQQTPVKDAILGSYVLLAALSQKCRIVPAALSVVVGIMSSCIEHVLPRQYINAILSVCEPQEELERLSKETVDAMLRVPSIEKELQDATVWVGIEKVLNPVATALVERLDDGRTLPLLESIIATPKAPPAVVLRIALRSIRVALTDEASLKVTSARRLLAVIQQRHSSSFREAMDTFSIEGVGREVIDQLRISLTIVQGIDTDAHSSENVDMVLATTNADAQVRALAVNRLLEQLSKGNDMTSTELKSAHHALLARVQDHDQGVIDALYSQPQILLPVLNSNTETYITDLANTLFAPGTRPKRSLIRAHIKFLMNHFYPANNNQQDNTFQRIIFPFLVFTKGRQHTTEAVWDIITSHANSSHEWLNGCIPIVTGAEVQKVSDGIEKMARVNLMIASQIALNIAQSKNYPTQLDSLISRISDTNLHTRVLSYLIVRALLAHLRGTDQIEVAHRILDTIATEGLSKLEGSSRGGEIYQHEDDMALARAVVTKPSSRITLQSLQFAVIATMATIPRPSDIILNWMCEPPQNLKSNQGTEYVLLSRKIYALANISDPAPVSTSSVLRSLFVNIGSDTLAFLAGIWVTPASGVEQGELQTVALHHASAFLQASLLGNDGVDFQTILPSLLVALQSHDLDQRKVAMKCIYHLHQLADQQFTIIYGFDTIYGRSQSELQYLERDDLKRYVNGLVEQKDYLVHDTDHLKLFHQQHLSRNANDKKRSSQYKRRVLCFVASHINAIAIPTAQIILLKSIESTSNSAKAETLLPTIKNLISLEEGSIINTSEDLLEFAVTCFDQSVATILNNGREPLWDVFISLTWMTYRLGSKLATRKNLSHALENGLFSALRFERQLVLSELLLNIGASDAGASTDCKQLLGSLIKDVTLITHILDLLLPAQNPASRATKRAKTARTPENSLPHLILFAEILVARSLPGSFDLISHLLEALSRVIQLRSSPQTDLGYIEQLLMSAVEDAASKATEIPNLSPSAVRLDVLVDVIRVADNPQTFHQALLLMANIARLVPESVLHHVMPIFTFMGSNVFHRDDAYSFKVVQQTIDSIVPVMALSLKRSYTQPLDLYIGAKGFLRVFTDAANHIPRHRRTKFFVHLVDVLGSDQFLPPVCMLLVEKVSNRVLKQSDEEIQNSFALPVSVLHHYEPSLQIGALAGILQETKRLAERFARPDSTQPLFLEVPVNSEDLATQPVIIRRRAQVLILFAEHALKSSTFGFDPSEEVLRELVSILIQLATPQDETGGTGNIDDIRLAAQTCLNRALSVMAASDLTNSVFSILESHDKLVQVGALELLSERLLHMSNKARLAIVPVVIKIIDFVKNILASKPDESLALASFKALRSVGLTSCTGEETSITEVVPLVLSYIKRRVTTAPAISALSSILTKIGPRIIPYFREIVSQSLAIIREDVTLITDIMNVLHSLLLSIPAFWGTEEIAQIVILHADIYTSTGSPPPAMLSLMKTMAKRSPANILLPTLPELWLTFKEVPQRERLLTYFDFLSRSLRGVARSDVLENLRPISKVFLESFELAKDPKVEVEAQVISAFRQLVVHLNEATFRPLFRRLYDWAFVNSGSYRLPIDDEARKVTFCHVYVALLDFFKGLMTPYMSFLLSPFEELLKDFGSGLHNNPSLWAGVVETLTKSLNHDDGVFWRDDRLLRIASPLVKQIPACIALNAEGRSSLLDCLVALVDNVTDEMLLKSINIDILMYTRADDVKIRLCALACSEKLWTAHGGKLLGFATEVATFIAECTEDENDMVVRESFKLKDAVESVAGNINGL